MLIIKLFIWKKIKYFYVTLDLTFLERFGGILAETVLQEKVFFCLSSYKIMQTVLILFVYYLELYFPALENFSRQFDIKNILLAFIYLFLYGRYLFLSEK